MQTYPSKIDSNGSTETQVDTKANEIKPVDIYKFLALKSEVFANLLTKNGRPPVWQREQGFESLIRIILEQAVSLESARAVFEKCRNEIGEITPESFLEVDDKLWAKIGFSRMKWRTCYLCAEKVAQGEINLFPASRMEDEDLSEKLIRLPGIGPWTVDIYFLLVLQRPDIWPVEDRALAVSVSQIFELKELITRKEFVLMAEPWRPYRSWAARVFWHDYLIRRNRLIV
jgi:DNA-3-methyladenine glycosylase II